MTRYTRPGIDVSWEKLQEQGLDRLVDNSGVDYSLLDDDVSDYNSSVLASIFGVYAHLTDSEGGPSHKDPANSYRVNSFGFRDEEYEGTYDLVTGGCSQTYGQGVPEEARWSTQLGKLMGYRTATIATPGWSTQGIISSVMNHIKTYGKPKIVSLLLPDFSRYDMMINLKVASTTGFNVSEISHEPVAALYSSISGGNQHRPKLSKLPHNMDEVLSSETSYFMSGQALSMFAEYCRAAGIILVWGTWDEPLHQLVQRVKKISYSDDMNPKHTPHVNLDEYVDLKYFHDSEANQELLKEECHAELRASYTHCFDLGTDTDNHMGVHQHAHIAETFKDRVNHLVSDASKK